jgi:hypothetical protein
MSGSALMSPQVNLDEFERRLRAAGSPVGPQEDPLDELARLVGAEGREAKPPQRMYEYAAKADAPRLPPVHDLHVDQTTEEGEHPLTGTEAATMEDASLRGALDGDDSAEHFEPQIMVRRDDAAHSDALQREALALAGEATSAPRRSGRMALTMGALVAVGAAGLVGAWIVKGAPGLPKTPPTIMAADGPTKVQPPTQDTVVSPNDSASVLLKDQKGKSDPVKLVSSEEQPVDLQQQVQPQAAPAPVASSATAPAAVAGTPSSPATPATRTIGLTSVGPTAAAPAAPAPFPEPKRVKTVSVRPDGSVISSGSEAVASAAPATDPSSAAPPASAAPAAAATPDGAAQPANPPVPHARPAFDASVGSAAQPATPKLDLPTKLAPKAAARAPVAKTDTTVANAADQSPETPAQKTPLQIVPDFIQGVAKAVTGQPQSGQPQPTRVATADPVATATTTGSGSYAVQLAAPGTDKEAQSASTRLKAKYANELGGMQPTIHQADVNGRPIYRVRVSGLAKADAVSLCQKLKASGGEAACFIAKD